MNILSTLDATKLIGQIKEQLLPVLQSQLAVDEQHVKDVLEEEVPKLVPLFTAALQTGESAAHQLRILADDKPGTVIRWEKT
jgi:hypothetical protein